MKKLFLGLIVSIGALPIAQAGITPDEIDQAAAAVQPQVVEWRRWFHQNPELSNREFNTSAKIAEILRGMGLEPQTGIAHTGLIAIIEGGLPGPLVAIRTDIDGLPVVEQTGLPFASTARSEYNGQDVGVMHACGHDAHMAMVLGAAKILNDNKAELPGSVMLIFQPAEEGPPAGEDGGASMMLDEGIFAERMPAAVFGIHVGISIPGGQFAVKPGPMMAAADIFKITVKGKQTHGARPWDGVDPIVVSSQIVLGLQTIASRQVDVTQAPSIISVGRISGGIRNNVIPDKVEMEGTIRSFDPEMREYIHTAIERTATLIAESGGAEVEVDIRKGPPALLNNTELTLQMMPALERASGRPPLSLQPQTVAEDFSEYGRVTPAVFVFLGNWPEDLDPSTQPTNHSPFFNMHEPYMEKGVKAFGHMVVDFLNAQEAAEK
ncbi:MAG: amidohydrolase [Xanthomonadales bacterium]|nr:amidohydrolase [Xanthomonadales bacterium]